MASDHVRFTIRIPAELADRVREQARLERRSLNAQAEKLLERGLAAPRAVIHAPAASLDECPRERHHRQGQYCKACGTVPIP